MPAAGLLLTALLLPGPPGEGSGEAGAPVVLAPGESHMELGVKGTTVKVHYHAFALFRLDGSVTAVHLLPDPRFRTEWGGTSGVNARWFRVPGDAPAFFGPESAKVSTGAADLDEGVRGSAFWNVGGPRIEWSQSSARSGWLYFADVPGRVEVYPEQFETLGEADAGVAPERWRLLEPPPKPDPEPDPQPEPPGGP